jgi:hypothetical protein
MKTSLILAALGGACALAVAGSASAECDSRQEALVGQAIAQAARDELPAQKGQRYVDLKQCEGGSSKFDTRFRYSLEHDGRTTWVEGRARGKDDRVDSLTVSRVSPDLEPQSHARAEN